MTFNPITKIIQIDEAPIDGVVNLNVKIDLYSDGKEDWTIYDDLIKHPFPIRGVGGDPLPGEKALGSSFFLDNAWKIRPYEEDHILNIVGNLYSEDGSSPFIKTVGKYNVFTTMEVSNIITSVISGSGVTEQDKEDIKNLILDEDITLHTINNSVAKELSDVKKKIAPLY